MASIVISTKSKNDLQLIISVAERLNCSITHVPDTASKLIEGKNFFDSVSNLIKKSDSLGIFNPLNLTKSLTIEEPMPTKKKTTRKTARKKKV